MDVFTRDGKQGRTRRTRSDGERSRRTILDAAARLATVDGLGGLSIGNLAKHIGMSKSGLYAHFDSKEDLQIATIRTAREITDSEVTRPALEEPDPLRRVIALCENYLSYVERDVFPGGCFFASTTAEFDTRPGTVRDLLASMQAERMRTLTAQITAAMGAADIVPHEDPEQLAFECNALLHLANDSFVLGRNPDALTRARRGLTGRLLLAASAHARPVIEASTLAAGARR